MKTAIEMVERMEAFVRKCDDFSKDSDYDGFVGKANGYEERELRDEARAIVAELPPPVDPDLLEARRVGASMNRNMDDWLNGMYDRLGWTEGFMQGLKHERAKPQ